MSAPDNSKNITPASTLPRRTFLEFLAIVPPALALSLCSISDVFGQGHTDADLEYQIESYIKKQRARSAITSDEETSWSIYDFTKSKKLVSINEDVPRQAASMIKPFVALAYFYKASEDRKRYPYNSRMQNRMRNMIQHSNNSATNQVLDILSNKGRGRGPQETEAILKAKAPGIFQQTRIVERIPAEGSTYRNMASAHDYSRFLFALWQNSFPYSTELKRLMLLPNKDRIYTGARKVPIGTHVYDKTGTTARLCGNMGVLIAKGRNGKEYPYSLIGIIEKRTRTNNLTRWIKSRGNVIREVSNITYAYLQQKHNLI
ncbi:MAG: class A beta-lactamase-related serine hydrolase [Candidatus Eisenbacteria bacterium]|nr:class A beta-lactamase-related serine hydrolase [Candidatus Eisenbacteria bacterium]MBU1948102.1 class A beta-lactamase-related serine hydrolase [Candidatus Eisenbacteria bacterium]